MLNYLQPLNGLFDALDEISDRIFVSVSASVDYKQPELTHCTHYFVVVFSFFVQ